MSFLQESQYPVFNPTNDCDGFRFIETCKILTASSGLSASTHTGEVEKIRVLVKVVEDSARSKLDVGGSYYRNSIFRKPRCKLRSALTVFNSRDTGCDYPIILVTASDET